MPLPGFEIRTDNEQRNLAYSRSSTHLTSAPDGGEWSALPPGKELPVPVGWKAEWAPEPVWTRWRREKLPSLNLAGTEPRSSRP
jgi:hypothetical protein